MSEQAKKMPVLSENAESSGAPAQPTLSDNADSSCATAPLTPLEIIRLNMAGLERAYGKEEYMDDEEDDDEEEDDEQLGERLKRKFLHCETCVATSLIPRFCKCDSGRHVKGCALSTGGGNKKCGRCGGPVACTHDIFGPSGDFINTGRLPCGYCVLPALYIKMKGTASS